MTGDGIEKNSCILDIPGDGSYLIQ
ncbi:hypothetical protein HKBW3S09_02002, partial [Candidatus Hakubella thermalkaliphila]